MELAGYASGLVDRWEPGRWEATFFSASSPLALGRAADDLRLEPIRAPQREADGHGDDTTLSNKLDREFFLESS